MGTLNWPKSDLTGLLPVPRSTVGKVETDTADSCVIYVGDTPLEDYSAYVDECADSGFALDHDRGDKDCDPGKTERRKIVTFECSCRT